MLDAGRAVADDEVELLLQLLQDALDALALQGVLVARLRGRKNIEIVVALILDQRLIEIGVAVDHIDEIEHNAALAAHHEIEVAQSDVEIDDHSFMAAQCQPGGKSGSGGGLADPSLAGCDRHDLRHQILPPPRRSRPRHLLTPRCMPRSPSAMMSVNFLLPSTGHPPARYAPPNPAVPAVIAR